jgi:hypothetical protein
MARAFRCAGGTDQHSRGLPRVSRWRQWAQLQHSVSLEVNQLDVPEISCYSCKHRAALIVHLDIREPAIARQWAQLQRSASRTTVVA